MKLKYRYSESTIKPETIEINPNNTVYIRKDIIPEIRSYDENNSITYWTYQEALLTMEEFNTYAAQLMSLNAIKNMDNAENIKQLTTKQKNGDCNQMIIMEAIAEIYEMIVNMRREDI